jgi:predicted transposase/invertase (TIGR01784 family)
MYDSSLKYKWDNQNVLDYAKKEGIKIGKHKKTVAIAVEMKKEGLTTAQIAKFTRLSVEEIEKL